VLGYLYFIYLALSLYFPPILLLYSIYVFTAVLAVCILGTPRSFTLFVPTPLSHPASTLLAVITSTYCYLVVLSRIYVTDCWLYFLLGLLTREDGTETSVNNYHTTPRNNPEKRRSQVL
jgi:hypothetical protein